MYSHDDLFLYLKCPYAFERSKEVHSARPKISPAIAPAQNIWIGNAQWYAHVPRLDEALGAIVPILTAEPTMAEVLQAALAQSILGQGGDLHFDTPDGRLTLPSGDYAFYLREVQSAFAAALSRKHRPIPCAACASCVNLSQCKTVWREEDSLYQIAGVSKAQVKKLQASGISRLSDLIGHEGSITGLSTAVSERLKQQAALQKSLHPKYELRSVSVGKGFYLLPEASAADVFFLSQTELTWQVESADNLNLPEFISHLRKALASDSRAHFYHFGGQDLNLLRQSCAQQGVGEAFLDQMLRERRFIDLAAVQRGALMTSQSDQSLESMAVFFNGEGGNLQLMRGLRDWLLSLRPDLPWPEEKDSSPLSEEPPDDLKALLDGADLPQDRKQMLYDLGMFHEREAKPSWWAIFDSLSREEEALLEDLEALGGLRALEPAEPFKRSFLRRYRYAPQESKLRKGKTASIATKDGFASVTIEDFDRKARIVTLKIGAKNVDLLTDRLALYPDKPISSDVISKAMRDVIEDQCGPKIYNAVNDLLDRAPPRLHGAGMQADVLSVVRQMEQTTLAIQGPPGTGKTYVSARAILDLVKNGHRVGVASNSHEAIKNLLMGCLSALEDDMLPFEIIHKVSTDDYPQDCPIIRTTDNAKAIGAGAIVGGTAFFFARDENIQAFDWLFVDEAGQVGLANMAAMGRAARNIVLVGDPRQLPQVIQGSHPYPANLSCFEWLLGDEKTIPEDRGIFLSQTRRMHPKVNDFISRQIYDGRLQALGTEDQAVLHNNFPQAGAYFKPVLHEGNAQTSIEEIKEISRICDEILTGDWRDKNGVVRKIQPDDIIVVAPYNAQVNALQEALPHLRIGTVDKFQGQEAPICIVSMTASSAEETSRGMEFLFSLNRINVAISRAKALAIMVGAPALRRASCDTIEQMRLVNTICALPEM